MQTCDFLSRAGEGAWSGPGGDVCFEMGSTGEVRGIALIGELDLAARDKVVRALTAAPPSVIRVDLSGLTFVDVAGSLGLRDAHRQLVASGNHINFSGAPPFARRLFDLLGLSDVLGG